MTIAEIERELRAAIEAQVAKGYRLVRGITWSPAYRCCCALGAMFQDGMYIDAASRRWNVPHMWAPSFADGFDGSLMAQTGDPVAYELGRRLAAEYVDGVK